MDAKEEAINIDRHFDEMLVDGMEWRAALEVEAARDRAHYRLRELILTEAATFGQTTQHGNA